MIVAFTGATTAALGYLGILIGAACAGLVYVIIAIIIKFVGVGWINKLMPPVVIGPTVALIGLSLAVNAVNDLNAGKVMVDKVDQVIENGVIVDQVTQVSGASVYVTLICGLATLFAIFAFSVYGKKMAKLIPFILGILVGYAVSSIFTVIGILTDNVALQVINFAAFKDMQIFAIPDFAFIEAFKGIKDVDGAFIATVAVAYIPVAFVVFAEHIADHKNLSSIIDKDLLSDPGLHRTLLGDGVGSAVGAIFGGCPNTTYGESVGCVAITKNASIATITTTAVMAILISFVSPFVAFLDSIPGCVMGGVCITLYGFIAVSGLKMIQKVDLEDNANLFTVSAILIPGIGGMAMAVGPVYISNIACALILGIIVNLLLHKSKED
jgi:uracil permease